MSILPVNPTPSSSSNFQAIFSAAVKAYEKRTKKDLLAHPLACQLQTCNTTSSIIAVLQGQVDDLDQARGSDERLTKWLNPTVNVLLTFSTTIGGGVNLVRIKYSLRGLRFHGDHVGFLTSNRDIRRRWCPPPGVYITYVSSQVKLDIEARQAVKDVSAAQEALIDIFERIENFFKRLETYTEVRPNEAMTDIIVKIMVEVLHVFAIATEEIKQGRTSELPIRVLCIYLTDCCPEKYLKKLLGKTEIEDSLKRLDKLTQDEVRMATAQLLTLTHCVDDKVTRIDNEVKCVGGKVRDVDDKVTVVHEGTQYVMLSCSSLRKRLCG